jgi:hypothetical protein
MNKEMQNFCVKHGVYAGLIQSIFYLLMYFSNRALLADFKITFVIVLFILIYPLVVVTRYRKQHGNVLIFKDSFILVFFISVLRGILASLVSILLFTVIDPELAGFIKERLIKNMSEWMQYFGASDADIEKQVDTLKNTPDQFSLASQLKGILTGIPFAAFFSLIGAAIVKRNPPPFADNSLDVPSN